MRHIRGCSSLFYPASGEDSVDANTKTSTDLRLPAYKQSRTRSPTVKWRSPFAIMRGHSPGVTEEGGHLTSARADCFASIIPCK
jgi:hypothetical protein